MTSGIKKDAIGKQLCKIRKTKGITGQELASILDYSQASISKIENGFIKPTSVFIERFSKALNLSLQERQDLLDLTDLFLLEYDRWNASEPNSAARIQGVIQQKESSAATIRSFEWNYIFGLLQIEEYARAMFACHLGLTDTELESALSKRLERQKVLSQKSKQFSLVISENALYTRLTDESGHKKQLLHLKQYLHSTAANVRLRIIPQNTRFLKIPVQGFTVFDLSLVCYEDQLGSRYVCEQDTITHYLDVFNFLWDSGAEGKHAESIILHALRY